MQTPFLDLFRTDAHGSPIWLESVEDLETARLRLGELASAHPGEYFAFDQTTHQVVVNMIGLGSDQIQ
jgi:hypothetical protein